MNRGSTRIAAMVFAVLAGVIAGNATAVVAIPPVPPPVPFVAGLAGPFMQFVVGELDGKVVKGAPYSAEAVSETIQVLADGNRIVRRSVTRLMRDGEGRTRQERLVDGKVARVYINDVVAGRGWVLSPDQRVARELDLAHRGAPPIPPTGSSSEEMRSWAEAMRAWAREFGARFRGEPMVAPGAGGQPSVSQSVRDDGRVEVRVQVIDAGAASGASGGLPEGGDVASRALRVPPVPPLPPMPPLPLMLAPPGEGVTTSLGAREFDGVRADGTRTTWIIAAGRIGNDKPIEIVSDRWYAPDLMLVVATRRSDPRSGETNYRLTQLKRGEPDAALFRLPADYEVRGAGVRPDRRERK